MLETSTRRCAPLTTRLEAAVLLLLAGCGQCESPAPSPSDAGAVATTTELRSAEVRLQTSVDDELELHRLADQHPATELMDVVEAGEANADAALAALAHARDGELVLGRLGDLARELPQRRLRALRTILALASRPPADGERYDPSSLRHCIGVLHGISRDVRIVPATRALAVSALRAFARHGYLQDAAITTELDPAADRTW